MAKKPKDTANAGKQKKRAKRATLWLIIVSVFLVAFLRTGFIFFILAMMPAIVASFLDRTHSRSKFHTVFACNLAGTLPFLGNIIKNHGANAEIQDVMGDPFNWLIIYAAAAFGWLLVYAAPAFATGFINMLHQGQIARLERMQRKIVAEWGHEVENINIVTDEA
jgi:hypothetical protein